VKNNKQQQNKEETMEEKPKDNPEVSTGKAGGQGNGVE